MKNRYRKQRTTVTTTGVPLRPEPHYYKIARALLHTIPPPRSYILAAVPVAWRRRLARKQPSVTLAVMMCLVKSPICNTRIYLCHQRQCYIVCTQSGRKSSRKKKINVLWWRGGMHAKERGLFSFRICTVQRFSFSNDTLVRGLSVFDSPDLLTDICGTTAVAVSGGGGGLWLSIYLGSNLDG